MTPYRFDQYIGPWAISTHAAAALKDAADATDWAAHMASHANDQPGEKIDYEPDADGIATFRLAGMMTPYGSSFGGGTSSVRLTRAIRNAANDPAVRGAMLMIDSPGGTVAATHELALAVASFAAAKPIIGHVGGMCASAAVWASAACTRMYAGATSIIGSVGAMCVVEDWSAAAAGRGVKVHVVASGPLKGMGTDGAPVTDAHLAELQKSVNALAAVFREHLAAHRPGVAFDAVFQGGEYVGAGALPVGLIDGIKSDSDAMSELVSASRSPVRRNAMAQETGAAPAAEPKKAGMCMLPSGDVGGQQTADECSAAGGEWDDSEPAPVATLRKFFPLASADMLLECASAGLTLCASAVRVAQRTASALDDVRKSHAAELAAVEAKLAQANERLAAYAKSGGAAPVAAAPEAGKDAEKTDAQLRAEWSANAEYRKHFASAETYIWFHRNKKEG